MASLGLLISTPGVGELLVIAFIVLLIFGPGKLPQIGKALGDGIRSFKKATTEPDEIDVTPRRDELPRQAEDRAAQPKV